MFLMFFDPNIQKIDTFLTFSTQGLPNPIPHQIRKSQTLRTEPGSLRNWAPAPDQIRNISYQKPGVYLRAWQNDVTRRLGDLAQSWRPRARAGALLGLALRSQLFLDEALDLLRRVGPEHC